MSTHWWRCRCRPAHRCRCRRSPGGRGDDQSLVGCGLHHRACGVEGQVGHRQWVPGSGRQRDAEGNRPGPSIPAKYQSVDVSVAHGITVQPAAPLSRSLTVTPPPSTTTRLASQAPCTCAVGVLTVSRSAGSSAHGGPPVLLVVIHHRECRRQGPVLGIYYEKLRRRARQAGTLRLPGQYHADDRALSGAAYEATCSAGVRPGAGRHAGPITSAATPAPANQRHDHQDGETVPSGPAPAGARAGCGDVRHVRCVGCGEFARFDERIGRVCRIGVRGQRHRPPVESVARSPARSPVPGC